jgi:Short C-terminal domain
MALLMREMRRTAVEAGAAAYVSERALRRQRGRWAAQGDPAAAAAPDPSATAAALRRLAEMREAGVLTEEEFAAAKRLALGLPAPGTSRSHDRTTD